jgi:hypothetical protein
MNIQSWQRLLRESLFLLLNIVNLVKLKQLLVKKEILTMEIRTCSECNQPLRGRKDQKFCSDYCRNAFNNRLNEDSNKYVRRINGILRKNRRILEKLNPSGKSTVDGITLAEEGFNFHYYTNIYKTQKGSQYFFCYDYGYLKTDNDQYFLVQKQDYVK